MDPRSDWFRRCMRQVHMDFHMPEFPAEAITSFNAKEFVAHLVRGKINMVALFAKCHFGNSFYNTKVGHKHAGLPNDFLREAAAECRAQGIRTLAYYSLCSDKHAYDHYPHWRVVKADGTHHPVNGPWARVCVNTPYREELVLPQLEEIAADYPVDGFWVDIPENPPCYCDYCKTKFKIRYGRELTPETPIEEVKAFGLNSTARLLRELRLIRDRHDPDLRILTNGAWGLPRSRSLAEQNDLGCWESQPRSNYLSHSFAARYVRTLDVPVQVMSVRFYQGWGDLTLKPTAQMTTEFAAMIGNGTMAVSGDQVQVNGTLQPAVYDMFGEAFGFVREREELLLEAEPVRDTALLAPVRHVDRNCRHAHHPALLGAHKALLESQVQFDILNSLDLHRLDDYATVVLTEPCDFAPEVMPRLRSWVEAGGTLVAVGNSLVENGQFHLADVFGVDWIEPCVFSVSHFRPRAEVKGRTDELPLQMRGRSQKVVPTEARVLADLIYPEIESVPERAFRNQNCAPPSVAPSGYPFATVNSHGKGRAVYIAGSIFEVYWNTNHHWLRQFIDGVFGYLNPTPLYRIDAPPIVEANLMRHRSGDLLLNLIHYQVGHQASKDAIPAIERVHPLRDVTCRVKAAGVRSVVMEPTGASVPFEMDGENALFTVPELKYLAIARIAIG